MRFGSILKSVVVLVLALTLAQSRSAAAYSVLSHEQVVDVVWTSDLVPLLLARYPDLSPEQIKQAHAYAYGGAIIQDIGYYPFGSHMLSDMLHYVRSGDFVAYLLRESSDANEYAFALGALAHYSSDAFGHPAINHATADEFPKLRDRFGPSVTYDDSPRAHLQTEFGFDVLEVAQRHYAPDAYHDFIGFEVSKPVFERAFRDTYGLSLDTVMAHEDLAIGTYRRSVSVLIPRMTRVAIADYHEQIQQTDPAIVPKSLRYKLSRAAYQKSWGTNYEEPGRRARFTAFLLRHLPKIGPLQDLSLHIPKPDVQKQFLDAFNRVVDNYHRELAAVKEAWEHAAKTQSNTGPLVSIPNRDLDTGKMTKAGEYRLADQTYRKFLALVVDHPGQPIPDDVRADIVGFFASAPIRTLARNEKEEQEILGDLAKLRASAAGTPPPPTPVSLAK